MSSTSKTYLFAFPACLSMYLHEQVISAITLKTRVSRARIAAEAI